MIKDLSHYVMLFENVIPEELSKSCLKDFDNYIFEENTFYNPRTDKHEKKHDDEPWVLHSYVSEDLNVIILFFSIIHIIHIVKHITK